MAIDFYRVFGGTVFQRVIQLMDDGRFEDITDDVADNEIVIGQLSMFERSLFSYILHERNHVDPLKLVRNIAIHGHPTSEIIVLSQLLWFMIRERLNKTLATVMGIRKGFVIVEISPAPVVTASVNKVEKTACGKLLNSECVNCAQFEQCVDPKQAHQA